MTVKKPREQRVSVSPSALVCLLQFAVIRWMETAIRVQKYGSLVHG